MIRYIEAMSAIQECLIEMDVSLTAEGVRYPIYNNPYTKVLAEVTARIDRLRNLLLTFNKINEDRQFPVLQEFIVDSIRVDYLKSGHFEPLLQYVSRFKKEEWLGIVGKVYFERVTSMIQEIDGEEDFEKTLKDISKRASEIWELQTSENLCNESRIRLLGRVDKL